MAKKRFLIFTLLIFILLSLSFNLSIQQTLAQKPPKENFQTFKDLNELANCFSSFFVCGESWNGTTKKSWVYDFKVWDEIVEDQPCWKVGLVRSLNGKSEEYILWFSKQTGKCIQMQTLEGKILVGGEVEVKGKTVLNQILEVVNRPIVLASKWLYPSSKDVETKFLGEKFKIYDSTSLKTLRFKVTPKPDVKNPEFLNVSQIVLEVSSLDSRMITTFYDVLFKNQSRLKFEWISMVLGPPKPVTLVLSNLNLNPEKIQIGETVDVSVVVKNTGKTSKNYTITLKLDGKIVESKKVSLEAETSKTVCFTLKPTDVGVFMVEVDGLWKKLEIKPSKKCIIATTTYGSELAGEVQLLRGFRDNTVLKTFAGKQFMEVFNGWYYSFSPQIANLIEKHPTLKNFMKIVLSPLILILKLASKTYPILSLNKEIGIVIVGFLASFLIGIVYFSPPTILTLTILKYKKKFNLKTGHLKPFLIIWLVALTLIFLSEIIYSTFWMMVGTGMFVVFTIVLAVGLFSLKIMKHI